MATRYLNLDWSTSQLFEYSKTEKEEFELQPNDTYRKYERKGITGTLLNVGVRDSKIGQQINIAVKDKSDDTVIMKFSLYDQKQNVDSSYAESIISHLGNLEKGQVYTIFPYNLKAEDQQSYDENTEGRTVKLKYYDKRAVSFKQEGVKVNSFLSYKEGGPNSIPRLVWKEDIFDSSKKRPTAASVEEKNTFLLKELKRLTEEGGVLSYNSTSIQTAPPVNSVPSISNPEDEEHDLPF